MLQLTEKDLRAKFHEVFPITGNASGLDEVTTARWEGFKAAAHMMDAMLVDAFRFEQLAQLSKETFVNPRGAMAESDPDLRTHWVLPKLMCSGPVGGYVSFREAVDSLSKN